MFEELRCKEANCDSIQMYECDNCKECFCQDCVALCGNEEINLCYPCAKLLNKAPQCGAIIDGDKCQIYLNPNSPIEVKTSPSYHLNWPDWTKNLPHIAGNCMECDLPLCEEHACVIVIKYCNHYICPTCSDKRNQIQIKDKKEPDSFFNKTGDELFQEAEALYNKTYDGMNFQDGHYDRHPIQDTIDEKYLQAYAQYYFAGEIGGIYACSSKLVSEWGNWPSEEDLRRYAINLYINGLLRRIKKLESK
jgi:hypothetical protein